jgi:hypothetical protein
MSAIDSLDRWVITIPLSGKGTTTPAVVRELQTGKPVCTLDGFGQGGRWGIVDPDVLWFTNDNDIYLYYVTSHVGAAGHRNACTKVLWDRQTEKIFKGHTLTNCMGESDAASDGSSDFLCLSANGNGEDNEGTSIRLYDATQKKLYPAITKQNSKGESALYYGRECVDFADLTLNGNRIVVAYNGLALPGCTARDKSPLDSSKPSMGAMELYDGKTGRWIKTVKHWGNGHGARGIDTDGEDVLVGSSNWHDPTPPKGCENGIIKTRISDGREACLLNFANNSPPFPPGSPDIFREMHLSVHNNGQKHLFVVAEFMDNRQDATGTSFKGWDAKGQVRSDWRKQWGIVWNEIVLIPLDGKQAPRHLVHHRSFWVDRYWSCQRVSISRSGNYAVFDSSYGEPWPNIGVFVIKIR